MALIGIGKQLNGIRGEFGRDPSGLGTERFFRPTYTPTLLVDQFPIVE